MLPLDTPWGRVNLCGLREYRTAEECAAALAAAFSALSPDACNILLAHRPDYIDLYRQYPFDLVLSGTPTAGRFASPAGQRAFSPPIRAGFPGTPAGFTRWGRRPSSSAAPFLYPRLPRVFDPPEVVVIDVEERAKPRNLNRIAFDNACKL